MHRSGSDLILSATDLSNFLACAHVSTLNQSATLGGPKPPKFPDPGAVVLQKRGLEHEAQILKGFREQGLAVVEIRDTGDPTKPAARWTARANATLDAMRSGADIVFQGCIFDGRWLGLPDFLRKVDRPSELGAWSYEVIDAKLAREAKAGAVLQITLYSDLLAKTQGAEPESMHLALGRMGGDTEPFRYHDFAAYHRSVRARLLEAVEAHETDATYPEPVVHCDVCAWKSVCQSRWHNDDHLSLVAGITRKQREQLEARDVDTLAALGQLELPMDPELDGVSPSALLRIREQARIQLKGRTEGRHLHELFKEVPTGFGLSTLPERSEGDLFFDIESDPHVLEDGLEYLFGYADESSDFTGVWALNRADEKSVFEEFMDMVSARLEKHPELHIYHYGDYERVALKRLAGRHATREDELDRLLRGGKLVDLHRVVKHSLRASVESYSIKKLEPLFGFQREADLREANSALAHFEAWLSLGESEKEESELLAQIEGYNKDDCVATVKLRGWLEERREELAEITGMSLRSLVSSGSLLSSKFRL